MSQTSTEACSYLVDSNFASSTPSALEPRYIDDKEHWRTVACFPFLDAQESSRITRAFYVPLRVWLEENTYGQYCLLQAVHKQNVSGHELCMVHVLMERDLVVCFLSDLISQVQKSIVSGLIFLAGLH